MPHPACTWRSSIPGLARRGARSRSAPASEDRRPGGARQRAPVAGDRAPRRRGRGGRRVAVAAPARADLGDLPRPRHLRSGRRAPGAGRAAVRGRRADPGGVAGHPPSEPAGDRTGPRPRTRDLRRPVRQCGPRPRRSAPAGQRPADGPLGGDRDSGPAATKPCSRSPSPMSAPVSCSSTWTPTGASRWPSTAAARRQS